jgi:prepilin peptidase CpaA
MKNLHAVEAAVVVVLLVSAAWRDIATRSIPDIVSILIAACGLVDRALIGPSSLLLSTAASVTLFLLLLLAHARGMLGGGDVKLMAAMACGLSLPQLYHFIFVTTLSGGGLATLYLLLRRALKGLRPRKPPSRGTIGLWRVLIAERWRIARLGPLPYGVAITCGGVAVLGQRFVW